MPELPEVETVRRHLERHVVGRTIVSVWTSGLALRRPIPRALSHGARGRTIGATRRHGKFLIFDLDEGSRIIAHLGMTGKLVFRAAASVADRPSSVKGVRYPSPAAREPHTHVVLGFADGSALHYQDARRFGLFDWAPAGAADDRLGPSGAGLDPMVERLDAKRLGQLFRRCRGSIKQLLLDQKRIAGIGNIYASEALFLAGIGPRRLVHTLTRDERGRLAEQIHLVLERAVELRGTSFSDFRDLDDQPGGFAGSLLVYDREGEPCLTCGETIRRIVQGARSTFYCAHCQRRAARASTSSAHPQVARARGSRALLRGGGR